MWNQMISYVIPYVMFMSSRVKSTGYYWTSHLYMCVSTKLIAGLTNKVRESRMIKLLISLNMSFS